MRNIISKSLVLIAGLLSLTSCLGDGDDTYKFTDEFAYITVGSDGKKYAATRTKYISHSNIDALSAGDCVIANFGFGADNAIENIGFNADYFDYNDDLWFRASRQIIGQVSPIDTTALVTTDSVFNSITIPEGFYDPGNYFGNRWLATFSYKGWDGETPPKIEVFFDPNSQYDLQGRPLEFSSEKIIDIRMRRYGGGAAGTEKTISRKDVIDFSDIKSQLKEYKDNNTVYLRFRYHRVSNLPNTTHALYLTIQNNSVFFLYE